MLKLPAVFYANGQEVPNTSFLSGDGDTHNEAFSMGRNPDSKIECPRGRKGESAADRTVFPGCWGQEGCGSPAKTAWGAAAQAWVVAGQ